MERGRRTAAPWILGPRSHHPPCGTNPIGSVQAVIIDLRTGKEFGGADPRREGTVIGMKRRHHDEDGDDD